MLVTLIAENELKRKNPELLNIIDKILETTTKFTKERAHRFIESSTWPDDIKFQRWSSMNHWHYNSHYYYPENT